MHALIDRATNGKISNVGEKSPNKLLYTGPSCPWWDPKCNSMKRNSRSSKQSKSSKNSKRSGKSNKASKNSKSSTLSNPPDGNGSWPSSQERHMTGEGEMTDIWGPSLNEPLYTGPSPWWDLQTSNHPWYDDYGWNPYYYEP